LLAGNHKEKLKMTTVGTTYPTLLDIARRSDPNGKIETIVEMLTDTNEVLRDMSWVEGNLPTGNRTTIRTGLPTATWRKLNYGVQPSLSKTAQVTDACGMLEAYAEVDKALADLNGNKAAWRLSEDRAFLEAMNQAMATALFYGDTDVDPEKFNGLSQRYATISTDPDTIGYNIVSGGGSGGDNTSIWLVAWGDNTLHGIIPKGSTAGFKMEDLGQVTLTDAANGRYEGYRTHYRWDCGLTVRDWRYAVRIANIDISNLTGDSSPADLVKLMIKAVHKLPSQSLGRKVWYMNRDVYTWLDLQSLLRTTDTTLLKYAALKVDYGDVQGKMVTTFRGIPVRLCDALANDEATVS